MLCLIDKSAVRTNPKQKAIAEEMSESSHTCLNCNVKFQDADGQRDHYKTDWHRYNLKRRVAELPPVSAEEFQRRVIQQRTVDEQALQETTTYCSACRKQFISDKSYDNHLNSKKHKDSASKFEKENEGREDDVAMKQVNSVPKKHAPPNAVIEDVDASASGDVEEVDSDEWEDDFDNPIVENKCIFCVHHSEDLTENLQHMAVGHSFFVPDMEYVVDLNGLMEYLGEKVARGRLSVQCTLIEIGTERGLTFSNKFRNGSILPEFVTHLGNESTNIFFPLRRLHLPVVQ